MDVPTSLPLVFLILFLATFTRSALGFGGALIAMPLLTMVVGIRIATPLVAFMGITIALMILLKRWREVDVRSAFRLILASAVGVPVGIQLLQRVPEGLVKGILGFVLILFGVYQWLSPQLPQVNSLILEFLFGFFAGVLGGAYNINGPLIVVYGTLRKWKPEHFRATLQGYFLPTGIVILVSHKLAGLWTGQVFQYYFYSLPIILLGILIGGWAHKRLTAPIFLKVVYAFLILMGIKLMVGK
ncbi:MAG: sulfite exporter TauE/SafE family protein [Calditrichaeota bacterium]|nr:MAG: sulfite exporter TauE/SafE family protein [Calditrichota bacterium]